MVRITAVGVVELERQMRVRAWALEIEMMEGVQLWAKREVLGQLLFWAGNKRRGNGYWLFGAHSYLGKCR